MEVEEVLYFKMLLFEGRMEDLTWPHAIGWWVGESSLRYVCITHLIAANSITLPPITSIDFIIINYHHDSV